MIPARKKEDVPSREVGEVWQGPWGCSVTVEAGAVTGIELIRGRGPRGAGRGRAASPALRLALDELGQYLSGRRRAFSRAFLASLRMGGAAFQRRAWRALRKVPFGCVVSYGDLARMAGRPGAARAVGGAMGANPLPIVVPCHRVIASGGRIGGFGCGLEWKRFLLGLEGVKIA